MATFYIEQKITPFANQYQVFDSSGASKGQLVAFVHQKRMALRENILFYKDGAKQELLFQVKTQEFMEMAATYSVLDDKDDVKGRFKKVFKSSLLRSTWQIIEAKEDTVIATVRERSLPLAVGRRLWDFIPLISELPFFFKYHFDFIDPKTSEVMATYTKTALLRDFYRLEVGEKLEKQCDWRVLVAMGVSLDALQSR